MAEETIGRKIKRIRLKKRMGQQKLADLSGLDRTYISQIEHDKINNITLKTAHKLARGLGVRPEIFLADEATEKLYMSTDVFNTMVRELNEIYGFVTKDE